MYPTNAELRAAARSAIEFKSSGECLCARRIRDVDGRIWPGQELVPSFGVDSRDCCIDGMQFLADHLPLPFSGTVAGELVYAHAIDNGKGEKVAEAILSLLVSK